VVEHFKIYIDKHEKIIDSHAIFKEIKLKKISYNFYYNKIVNIFMKILNIYKNKKLQFIFLYKYLKTY